MATSSQHQFTWGRFFVVLILTFMVSSCSKSDKDNYTKVKSGMTFEEVVSILGQPTFTENASISGLAGKSVVWKTAQAEIDMQFLNNHLTVKSFSKLEDDKTRFD